MKVLDPFFTRNWRRLSAKYTSPTIDRHEKRISRALHSRRNDATEKSLQ